jgi:hypothetical protein
MRPRREPHPRRSADAEGRANPDKARILGAEEGADDAVGRSMQHSDDTWDYNKIGAKKPPYNPESLCVFLERSARHYRCVKAILTARLGFDFVLPEAV